MFHFRCGIGCTGLNKILVCLDIPTLSSKLYKRYDRIVGLAMKKAVKESCSNAAKLER